jgi:subtilisin family serine protease
VAIDITPAALDRARAESFLLKRRQVLPELEVEISVLQVPEGWSARRGLQRLRKLDPEGSYDFNHVYLGGAAAALAQATPSPPALAGTAGKSHRVGLIDGGIDGAHEVFAARRIERFGCEGQVVPSTHGTAVAAILLGRPTVQEIYAADVYCGRPAGGAVDTIAAAFAWLARERVAVINVSLVGPRNVLLERAVQSLVTRGFLIVAAVGNDGPAAPPLYPASYAGVIGVTAVDRHHRVLIEACRGTQVDFAARGADIEAATTAPATYAAVRGTSFAAPVIASLLAELQSPDPVLSQGVLARWTGNARDLGKQGRDDVYGAGELGEDTLPLAGPQGPDK